MQARYNALLLAWRASSCGARRRHRLTKALLHMRERNPELYGTGAAKFH